MKKSFPTVRFEVFVLPLLMLGTSTLSGCGDGQRPTYRAGGSVTLADGTPLAGGVVEFQSRDDQLAPTARATIQADGSYQLSTFKKGDGAFEGEHGVIVFPPPPKRFRGWEHDMLQQRSAPQSSTLQMDPRYQRYESSGLSFSVTRDASKNQFHIRIEPPDSQAESP